MHKHLDYLQIFENIEHPLLVLNHHFQIMEANSAFTSFVGYGKSQLMKQYLSDIFPAIKKKHEGLQKKVRLTDQVSKVHEVDIVIKSLPLTMEQNFLVTIPKVYNTTEQETDWRARNERLESVIHYFATSLYGKNTVEEILWDVTQNCISQLDFEDCVIYLLDEEQEKLVQKAAYGPKNPRDYEIYQPIEIPLGKGIVGSVALSGKAEMIADTSKDARYISDDIVRLSEIAVPLIYQDKVIGVIDSEHRDKGFFQPFHLTMLTTIASLCCNKIVETRAEEERKKAQLIQQEVEKLKELDRLKSYFFANISHELRTPLTLLLGLLEKQVEETHWVENTATMLRQAQRLHRLINQILDLTCLDAGKLDLYWEKGDLTRFLRLTAHTFMPLAKEKGIELKIDLPNEVVEACFDHDKLEKIIYNLLSNALKFTEAKGKVEVLMRIYGQTLLIGVKDTGIGIPEAKLDTIFHRFYQVHDSPEMACQGLGIGLALTKEFVKLHEGKIQVESSEGHGSVFTLQLPLKNVKRNPGKPIDREPGNASPSFKEKKSTTSTTPCETETERPLVLLADDDRDLLAYLNQSLQTHYRVIEAENGQEAMEKAEKYIPDLIVSDWMMPRVNGAAFCKHVKQEEKTCHIPFIMLTAKASAEGKLTGLSEGAEVYLTKPFSIKELEIHICNLIQQRRKLREKFSNILLLKPKDIEVVCAEEVFLKNTLEIIEEHLDQADFNVECLQKNLGVSRMQLHRKLKALVNQAPVEFIRSIRLQRAAQLLSVGQESISQIAYQVGFNNLSYFTKCFKQQFGCLPSAYLENNSSLQRSV